MLVATAFAPKGLAFGFIPYPEFRTKGKKKVSDTDKVAIFYLSGFLFPVCLGYGEASSLAESNLCRATLPNGHHKG